MLSNDPDALDYFYRAYASSVSGRRDTTLYTKDSSDGFEINMKSERSKVVDKLNALLGAIGFGLKIDYDINNEDDPDEYDSGISEIPDYIADKY